MRREHGPRATLRVVPAPTARALLRRRDGGQDARVGHAYGAAHLKRANDEAPRAAPPVDLRAVHRLANRNESYML